MNEHISIFTFSVNRNILESLMGKVRRPLGDSCNPDSKMQCNLLLNWNSGCFLLVKYNRITILFI